MNTNGFVVANLSVRNINGTDCLVNLSKDRKYSAMNSVIENERCSDDYGGSTVENFIKITNDGKFNSKCICTQHHRSTISFLGELKSPDTSKISISVWVKSIFKSDQFTFSSSRIFGPGHALLKYDLYENIKSDINFVQYASEGMYYDRNLVENKWNHFYYNKIGNVNEVYFNGNKILSVTSEPVGREPERLSQLILLFGGIGSLTMYDDYVFVLGENLFTSNFTPPISPILDNKVMSTNELSYRHIVFPMTKSERKIVLPPSNNELKLY